jgi:hypothetical protein
VTLCEKAKSEIDVLNLQLAKLILDEAEELCSSVKEIAQIRAEWQRSNDRYGSIAQKIRENADRKLYVTAKRDLDALKKQFPQYSNPELEEAISIALAAAKDALESAKRETDTMRSCKHAITAYQNCRDYPGIQEMLAKFQPAPVSSVAVKTDSVKRVNIITWQAPKSEIATYRIIRKAGSKPISIDDADAWWEVAAETYSDSDIEPNVAYYYAVASCVGPVASTLVYCSMPVVNLFEVQQLSVQNNKSAVYARWLNVPKNAEIEVWRDKAADPTKPGVGTKVGNVNVNEMADQGLENDATYQYRVFVKYRQGSNVVYSAGIPFIGIPTAPPRVIDYVIVKHKRENTFEVEWDADEGDNVSFYLTTELSVESEQVVDIAELNNLAMRTTVVPKGNNMGEFELPDSRMYFLFPVTQKNTTAVIGSIVPVTAQKLLSISKVQLSGNDVIVRFQWPNEINHVLLLYRNDRYPVSPGDTDARRMRVTKAVYDLKQAITLSSLPKGTYYFSLFAELQMSGTTTYSVPDFHTFRFGTLSKVGYDIKVQRGLGKLKGVSLTITPPEDGRLPALSVVANNGSLPVFRNQGFVVCDIPEQNTSRTIYIKLPVDKLSKNTFLKLFTKDPEEAANYEISLLIGTSPSLK